MEKYSVYVDGNEVNDFYLTKAEAKDLAADFEAEGYDDVKVVNMGEDEEL